jgi:hypothetical protein
MQLKLPNSKSTNFVYSYDIKIPSDYGYTIPAIAGSAIQTYSENIRSCSIMVQ